MPEFARIMAVAIVLFLGLFLLYYEVKNIGYSSGTAYVSSGSSGYIIYTEKEGEEEPYVLVIDTQERKKEVFLSREFTLSLGREMERVVGMEDNIVVRNGMFSREFYERCYKLPYPNGTVIFHFSVGRTNSYGELIVELNNETVLRKKVKRGYEDTITKSVDNDYICVKFRTTSSGWRIWADSYYEVSYRLSFISSPSSEKSFSIKINPGELYEITLLRLVFYYYGNNTITVRFNGERVYEGACRYCVVDIERDKIHESNLLTFSISTVGSGRVRDLKAILFFKPEREKEVYYLDIPNHMKGKDIHLTINITRVEGYPKALDIEFISRIGNVYKTRVENIYSGKNVTIHIPGSYVYDGTHKVVLSVEGAGKVYIGSIKVEELD